MLTIICIFVLQLLEWSNVSAAERRGHCLMTPRSTMSIGAVLDLDSLMGKQQKIAMEIAVHEFNRLSCSKLLLKIKDSHGNSTEAVAGENKANNGTLGFQPFLGLFYICGTVAALALLYAMICLVLNNVNTLMTLVQGPSAQLGRIWGWLTTFLGRFYSKLQFRKRLSPVTETGNAEETVSNREDQSLAVVELVDVVMAAHAS
ncbi:hypothetical protein VNO77_18982 [Canavalia gladiata]|uniref:Uncharacterized protein n=1 Tax=Canavalia gladiata TaxID=3824 RepID=A0AAN9QI47_CANGL